MLAGIESIGIIGGGTVGKALARAYIEHLDVRIYDTLDTRKTHSLEEALRCDLIFLCLPTPKSKYGGGSLHLDDIHEVLSNNRNSKKPIIITSTIPVGTTKLLSEMYNLSSLVYYPQFITERCAVIDAQLPPVHILGMLDSSESYEATKRLEELLHTRFPGVPILSSLSSEVEAAKLFINAFYAVKVAFFNEVHNYVWAKDLNWDVIREMILSLGTITPSHTQVPGPDGRLGFGGKCLPKDLDCIIDMMDKVELNPWICLSARERNRFDRNEGVGSL